MSRTNRKRRIVLHIGTEKTGTTTLQHFLAENSEVLAGHGFGYLKFPGTANARYLAAYSIGPDRVDLLHVNMKLLDPRARAAWRQTLLEDCRGLFSTFSNDVHTVIASAEHFSSRLETQEELSTLKGLLDEYADDYRVVMYMRRQDELACSLFSTHCRNGSLVQDILPQQVDEHSHYYNYANLLDMWASVFGEENVVARVFEKTRLQGGNIARDFLELVGIEDHSAFNDVPRKNEALSAVAQETLGALNLHFEQFRNNRPQPLFNRLRHALAAELNTDFPGDPHLPSRAEAERFAAIFSESNELLFNRWFNGEKIFSDDFSRYPEEREDKLLDSAYLDSVFRVFRRFLHPGQFLPRREMREVSFDEDRGATLRDIGLIFEKRNPRIALFLLKEAQNYRPRAELLATKVAELERRVAKMDARARARNQDKAE